MWRSGISLVGLAFVVVLAASPWDRAHGATPRAELANECWAILASEPAHYFAAEAESYGAVANQRAGAARFYLKPTGLATYLLRDERGLLLGVGDDGRITALAEPGPAADWRISASGKRRFTIATADGRRIEAEPGTGELALGDGDGAAFEFVESQRCSPFPEASVGASGTPRSATRSDGTVYGFADMHLHVSANLRAGGRVIHGEPYHPYGISHALGHDDHDHGPDGSLDLTGNVLRDGLPVGTHDTHGWPTFSGWPVHDTITHQQAYYVWLKRAWKAGLRVVVAQAIEDEALCQLVPLKSHSCDETETIKLAIRQLRGLEDYVDAQSGGPGRGWLRIVTRPGEARRVIERGKLAVVIGMESSSPLGCSEFLGAPQCDRAEIDRVLGELHGLGVRSVFIAHWVDNAYAGAALQGGTQGDFIGVFETLTTGHPFSIVPCAAADEADGRCNALGLTELGRYLIRQLIERRMLIEADHLSQLARKEVLAIAERHRYPLVSSHTGTGGEWTPAQLERLDAVGGLATATPEVAPELIEKILELRRYAGRDRAVALGSDTGGLTSLPGPAPEGARPLRYPFTSHDGRIEFVRQRTGERVYDLNIDGVAHYGLIADLIADIERQPNGGPALRSLFGSAEAYLRMWARTRGQR